MSYQSDEEFESGSEIESDEDFISDLENSDEDEDDDEEEELSDDEESSSEGEDERAPDFKISGLPKVSTSVSAQPFISNQNITQQVGNLPLQTNLQPTPNLPFLQKSNLQQPQITLQPQQVSKKQVYIKFSSNESLNLHKYEPQSLQQNINPIFPQGYTLNNQTSRSNQQGNIPTVKNEIRDIKGNILHVGNIIIFNSAASYYRQSYVVGVIKKITPTGGLNLSLIKIVRTLTGSGNILNITNLNDYIGDVNITLKRGKDAGPGNYRYDKKDISVELYNPNETYYETYYD